MKLLVLPLAILVLALSACGSSGPTIPKAAADSPLEQSYSLLRSLGLRVEVQFLDTSTLNVSSEQDPIVQRMWPAPGTHVKPGSVVTLPAMPGMIGSPVVLKSHPRHRVPSFVGRPAAAAIRWADTHDMYWAIPDLPPLYASPARELFAAYRVVAQQPKPGSVLGQGHRTRAGGYRLTPLTLTVAVR
jgi:hypothetical protein